MAEAAKSQAQLADAGAEDELAFAPATELLRAYRERTLSPVEVVEAVIERTQRVEPRVNALTASFFEAAQAAARRAERRYADGARMGPLEGVPVLVKDEVPVRGQPCTNGSLTQRGVVADASAPLAERLIDAGAILHARTTTPEFSCAGFTHSRLWGVTRNPWNAEYSPGGSSGGSAAALAAGLGPLATGSDIGGSIRVPAAFCGVVGYKPPFGRVPDLPPFNLDHYCANGPMARTVGDCALLQNVLSGQHPRDIATLRPKRSIPTRLAGIEGWRVALCIRLGGYPVQPEIEASARRAAAALADAGAIVEEVELPWSPEEIRLVALVHYSAIMTPFLKRELAGREELASSYTLEFARVCADAAAELPYADGLEREAEIYAPLGKLLDTHMLLLCPTVAVSGFPAGDDLAGPLRVDGAEVEHYFDLCMTIPFNVCGRCPVLGVPAGRLANGLPAGVQIVGRPFDDVAVFRAAAAYERAGGMPPARPPI